MHHFEWGVSTSVVNCKFKSGVSLKACFVEATHLICSVTRESHEQSGFNQSHWFGKLCNTPLFVVDLIPTDPSSLNFKQCLCTNGPLLHAVAQPAELKVLGSGLNSDPGLFELQRTTQVCVVWVDVCGSTSCTWEALQKNWLQKSTKFNHLFLSVLRLWCSKWKEGQFSTEWIWILCTNASLNLLNVP